MNRFFRSLLPEVKKLHPKTILDVGCGEGFVLNSLRKHDIGKDLIGIDYSKTAISIGKKLHPSLDLREGTIYKLPFKDNSFDLVLCLEVLEHLDDPKAALKELTRVSKKYTILSVPNEPWFMIGNFLRGKNMKRWGNDIEHINHWSAGSFKKFVQKYTKIYKIKRPLPWTLIVGVK